MVKVLVTGGAGYIGSHVVHSLIKSNYDVVIIDNLVSGNLDLVKNVLKVPIIIGEISNSNLIESILNGSHPLCEGKKIEAVMHFAGFTSSEESVKDPQKYYENNLSEALILLNSILNEQKRRINQNRSRIPFLFSSSCSTYGIPSRLPIKEEDPQFPINAYGKSKLMFEYILDDFWKAYNIPSVIFRYFNAAGANLDGNIGEKRCSETHIIPLLFAASNNKASFFKIFGDDYPTPDGTCIRDYIHVVDIADAHVKGLKKILRDGGKHTYNLGTGKGFSVREIISEVELIISKSINIKTFERREGDIPVLIASAEKARKELNWIPKYSDLRTIINSAYKWHQKSQLKNFLN